MHGLLHVALRDLVLQLRSYGFWDLIVERTLEELHCLDDPREDDLLDTTKSYTDGVTEVLFKHAFAVLKCDRETGMLLVGDRHVRWLAESGYLSHLRRIDRSNVLELLEGVTKIHSHIERSFAHAIVPFFKVFPRSCPGGAFMIAYSSERATTAALFRGALIAAAELLCGQRLRLEEVPPPGAFDIAWLVQEVELFDTPELKGGHGLRGSSAQGLADLHTLMVPEVSSSPAASSTRTSLSDFPMPRLSISNYADTPTADGSIAAPRRSHQRTRRESDPDWASAAALNETTGQAREAILAEIERTHADALAQGIKAAALMRCVDPESVAADYTDPAQLSVASRFWAQSTGRLEHFLLSRPVPPEHADSLLVFVSHVWPEPADFAAIASVHVSYAEAKAIELGYAVQDLRRMRFGLAGADTASVLLWVDKACVAQEPHNLQATYLSHIQAFIALSGEMIVLLSWSYFERLWCVRRSALQPLLPCPGADPWQRVAVRSAAAQPRECSQPLASSLAPAPASARSSPPRLAGACSSGPAFSPRTSRASSTSRANQCSRTLQSAHTSSPSASSRSTRRAAACRRTATPCSR